MRPLYLICGHCGREFELGDRRAAWRHEHQPERLRAACASFATKFSLIAIEISDRLTPALQQCALAFNRFAEAWKRSI